jgi:hypothetical protein
VLGEGEFIDLGIGQAAHSTIDFTKKQSKIDTTFSSFAQKYGLG